MFISVQSFIDAFTPYCKTMNNIEEERKKLIKDVVSYHSEGNINLQVGHFIIQEEIDNIKEEVYSFDFSK